MSKHQAIYKSNFNDTNAERLFIYRGIAGCIWRSCLRRRYGWVLAIQTLTKFADGSAKFATDLANPTNPEYDNDNNQNDQQFGQTEMWHVKLP